MLALAARRLASRRPARHPRGEPLHLRADHRGGGALRRHLRHDGAGAAAPERARRRALGVREPWQFFWATGALSSFLDNAPTYLTFAAAACGLDGIPLEGRYLAELPRARAPRAAEILAAISLRRGLHGRQHLHRQRPELHGQGDRRGERRHDAELLRLHGLVVRDPAADLRAGDLAAILIAATRTASAPAGRSPSCAPRPGRPRGGASGRGATCSRSACRRDMPSEPRHWIARSSTLHHHVRHHHLDHRDLLAGRLLAVLVHLPGGLEREQPRLVDLHARERDPVLHELLLAERAAEGDARVRVAAHDLERALGVADRAHAVVDAAGAEARLRDHEAAAARARAGSRPGRGSSRTGSRSGRRRPAWPITEMARDEVEARACRSAR